MSSSPIITPASSSAEPVERAVADRLAAAIRTIPGVADLYAGRYGEIALLYPRHRVHGLRRTPSSLETHLVVDLAHPRPLAEVAAQVRGVVTRYVDAPVDVYFAEATGGAA